MIKQFAIFKNKEKKHEKSPDYSISIKVGDKYINAGGCWLKEGKAGKFFSCQLSEGYKDYPGFSIIKDNQIEKDKAKLDAFLAGEETKKDIKAEEIPF